MVNILKIGFDPFILTFILYQRLQLGIFSDKSAGGSVKRYFNPGTVLMRLFQPVQPQHSSNPTILKFQVDDKNIISPESGTFGNEILRSSYF